jgi:hypothetical protein
VSTANSNVAVDKRENMHSMGTKNIAQLDEPRRLFRVITVATIA